MNNHQFFNYTAGLRNEHMQSFPSHLLAVNEDVSVENELGIIYAREDGRVR
jgi:hypothetical protein